MKQAEKYWLLPGIAAILCILINPWTGGYALVAAVVLGAGYYVQIKITKFIKQTAEGRQLSSKMSRKQKISYAALCARQEKYLRSLSKGMMPVLFGGDALLMVYTCWYNMSKNRSAAVFAAGFSRPVCWMLVICGAVLLACSGWLFYCRCQTMLAGIEPVDVLSKRSMLDKKSERRKITR